MILSPFAPKPKPSSTLAAERAEILERIAALRCALADLAEDLSDLSDETAPPARIHYNMAREWADSAWRTMGYAEEYVERIVH